MLLTGTYVRSLDDKLRIAVPKQLRRQAADDSPEAAVYIAPGTDGCLALYEAEALAGLARRLAEASPLGPDVRAFSRLFYAQAQRLEFDRQGRIRIPAELAQAAGLAKEAVLLGVQDHVEIWDRRRWEEYLTGKAPHYDEIAEAAFGGPSTEVAKAVVDRSAREALAADGHARLPR